MAGMFGAPPFVLTVSDIRYDAMVSRQRAAFTIGDKRFHFCDPKLLNNHGAICDGPLGLDVNRSLGNHALIDMLMPFALEVAEGRTWEELGATKRAVSRAASRHVFGIKGETDAEAKRT